MKSRRKVLRALDIVVGFAALSSVLTLFNVTGVYADTSAVDTVTVTVPVSCSITGTVSTAHTATVEVGTYEHDIGTTTFKVLCNDANGFAVYAVGYSDDTYGNTTMKPSTLAAANGIVTGTATSGATSNWAMKLTAVSGTYTPTLVTGFNDYHAVPDVYTKVASFAAGTDTTSGSQFTSTYAAFISQAQPADTYTGKVKYTIVHPANAATPTDTLIMQNVSEWGSLVTAGQEVTVVDARDDKTYTVARLADGNLWMTQNLDLDINSTNTYTPADTDIPANWTPSASTLATNDATWTGSYTAPESYDPGDLYWNGTQDTTGVWNDYFDNFDNGGENPASTFTSSTGNSHNHLGNYYNWTAAVAMNDSSSYTTQGTLVDQSICPAGWTLPRAGYGDDTFYALINKYDTWDRIDHGGWTSQNGTELWASPTYFSLSGYWYGLFVYVGYGGVFQSPVVGDFSYSTRGMVLVSDGSVDDGGGRDYGSSVRCVARPVASTVSFPVYPIHDL